MVLPSRCTWTLATTLHIRALMPTGANQVREKTMAKKAKKALKKSKKLQPTKPLLSFKGNN